MCRSCWWHFHLGFFLAEFEYISSCQKFLFPSLHVAQIPSQENLPLPSTAMNSVKASKSNGLFAAMFGGRFSLGNTWNSIQSIPRGQVQTKLEAPASYARSSTTKAKAIQRISSDVKRYCHSSAGLVGSGLSDAKIHTFYDEYQDLNGLTELVPKKSIIIPNSQ